jgi:PAS domain S-box-containing protein
MNQRCVDFFDVPPAWVAWLRQDFILDRVHGDDARQLPAVRYRLGQLADDDQLEWEMRLRDRYDEWRWLRFWFTVFSRNPDGTPRQILATAIDVTESKAAVQAMITSEQEKSLILRSVSEHVSYQDEHQRILWANRAAAEAVGLNPEELVGRSCHDVWRHCEDAPEDCPVVRAQQTGREEWGEKATPDGRVWNVRAYPVFDATRCTRGAVVISQEITEAKRVEAERAALQDQLHQAQKIEAVGQLASGTAHEFNNLLMVILAGTGQLRQSTAGNEHAEAAVRAIEDAARQAERVTKSLLTFCHRMPGEKECVDLGGAIRSSVQLLERLMPATINVEAGCDTDLWVLADKTQLQQIILNLAINARDAMPNGGRLVLSACPATGADLAAHGAVWDEAESYARLDVRDTGTGMTPEIQSRVFEPFFTTKVRGQGTGLGLAVVHGIVEEHGGHVFVESAEGEGSTFTIYLPTVPAPAIGERGASAGPMPRGHGEVVLLAEDHRHVREIIAATLSSLGYEVIQFGDGPALLTGYAEHRDRVRLLLVDVDLPGQSGLSCIRQLRAEGVAVPAILSTGRPDVEADELAVGRTVLLRKPFVMLELAILMRSTLETVGEN